VYDVSTLAAELKELGKQLGAVQTNNRPARQVRTPVSFRYRPVNRPPVRRVRNVTLVRVLDARGNVPDAANGEMTLAFDPSTNADESSLYESSLYESSLYESSLYESSLCGVNSFRT
jgi:hypothetical protein